MGNAVTAILLASKLQAEHFAEGLYYRNFLIMLKHLRFFCLSEQIFCAVYLMDFT